jgi:hypothetical protein
MRRNLQIFLALVVVLAVWAACRQRPPAKDEVGRWIRLEESSHGCFHGDKRRVRWKPQGDQFVSLESPTVFTVAQVKQMRQAVRNSSHGRSHFAEEIGFTPQSLKAREPEILRSVGLSELPPEMAGQLEYARVMAVGMAFETTSTTQTSFKLDFDGDPHISVEYRGRCEFGYPWAGLCFTPKKSSSKLVPRSAGIPGSGVGERRPKVANSNCV